MTQPKRWVVTTSPDHEFGEVARELASRGFAIEHQMDAIGVVVGSALDDGGKLVGVRPLDQDRHINLGHP